MTRPNRRLLIADAAIELAADGGNHAVTHQAIDRHLDLPKGSTSYYFRTREALVAVAADRIVERSRSSFTTIVDAFGGAAAIDVIAGYVDELITVRQSDIRARYALLTDPSVAPSTRAALARCLFSLDAAQQLFATRPTPDADAARLISALEGLVFTQVLGVGRSPDHPRQGHHVESIATSIAAMFPALDGRHREPRQGA